MKTPVSRAEKLAGLFMILSIIPAYIIWVHPTSFVQGRFGIKGRFEVYILAEDAQELGTGDKVMMKGIQIGEVKWLELEPDHSVRVACGVYKKYRDKISKDARFVLHPPAVVGSGHVEVIPGNGPPLSNKQEIQGVVKKAMLAEVTAQIKESLHNADALILNANSRLGQMESALADMGEILQQMNEGKGSFGKFVADSSLYDRLDSIAIQLEQTIGVTATFEEPMREMRKELPTLTANLVLATTQINSILSSLQEGLENFPGATEKILITLKETRKILESVKRSFLIRGNLPTDNFPGTAPASRRMQ